jgi:pentatricopeptide repeat protein
MSGLSSPLILKYHKTLEDNPKSRVFAPLAESYRKLGQIDEALQILKSGLRHHPTYILGHLGLADCYFEIEEFNLAYTTLKPFIKENKDNLRLMKLFASICLKTDAKDEALDAFKYLLFLNPRDREVANNVKILEDEIKQSSVKINFSKEDGKVETFEANAGFNLKELESHPAKETNIDEWIQIDFQTEDEAQEKTIEIDQWNLKKNETLPKEVEKVESHRHFSFEVKENVENKIETNFSTSDSPVITHTLVDLYCKQGHIEKACEILENILALNPNDQKTKAKLTEVMALLPSVDEQDIEEKSVVHDQTLKVLPFEQSEEESREHLMSFFTDESDDNDLIEEPVTNNFAAIQSKLLAFNDKIQQRASRHLERRL